MSTDETPNPYFFYQNLNESTTNQRQYEIPNLPFGLEFDNPQTDTIRFNPNDIKIEGTDSSENMGRYFFDKYYSEFNIKFKLDFDSYLSKRKKYIMKLENEETGKILFTEYFIDFVIKKAKELYEEIFYLLSNPKFPIIAPYDNDTVDIEWRTNEFTILINIFSQNNQIVIFAKNNQQKTEDFKKKGKDPEIMGKLLNWIKQNLVLI